MIRRPLAADLWEQALINGRMVHPSSGEDAVAYAHKWYKAQGGLFDPQEEPQEEPQEPQEEGDDGSEPVAQEPQEGASTEAAEAAESEVKPEPEAPARRTRARHSKGRDGGQFKGDDPSTPDRDEAYVEG